MSVCYMVKGHAGVLDVERVEREIPWPGGRRGRGLGRGARARGPLPRRGAICARRSWPPTAPSAQPAAASAPSRAGLLAQLRLRPCAACQRDKDGQSQSQNKDTRSKKTPSGVRPDAELRTVNHKVRIKTRAPRTLLPGCSLTQN